MTEFKISIRQLNESKSIFEWKAEEKFSRPIKDLKKANHSIYIFYSNLKLVTSNDARLKLSSFASISETKFIAT